MIKPIVLHLRGGLQGLGCTFGVLRGMGPVDTLRKAAGDVSALDLPARELLICRPAHGGHLLVAYHVSGQIARKGCYL